MRVAPALCRKPTVDSIHMSWDQILGTEISYGLEVRGSVVSRPAVWPIQPPIRWAQGFAPGVKAAGARCWPLTSI